MGGRGNPYHDPKTGKFTNALGEIDDYRALTEQELQISRNEETAARLNGEEPFYSKTFYEGAENSYKSVKALIEREKDSIPEDFDFNDISKTMDLAAKLYSKATGESSIPACYKSAGVVSAMLDSKGIEHTVLLGFGGKDKGSLEEVFNENSNAYSHAWVRQGNNIYDTFNSFQLKTSERAPKAYREAREFTFNRF